MSIQAGTDYEIHDLWEDRNLGRFAGRFERIVAAHDILFVSVVPATGGDNQVSEKDVNGRFGRRSFLTGLGATALTLGAHHLRVSPESAPSFRSAWPHDAERHWPGEAYWPNPLQDWRVRMGRLECFGAGGDRNVALLTRDVGEHKGDVLLQVDCGPLDQTPLTQGFVGFRVGVKHQVDDYRAAAIYGRGMNVGINADGRLFIGQLEDAAPRISLANHVHLELHARPSGSGYNVSLRATDLRAEIAETTRDVPGEWLRGGLALVCSSGASPAVTG